MLFLTEVSKRELLHYRDGQETVYQMQPHLLESTQLVITYHSWIPFSS